MSDFDRALSIVLGHEGGVSDHKADRGGLTKAGVTTETYRAYRHRKGLPLRPVTQITQDEIREIYRGYWDGAHCAELPWPVSLFCFDCAINSGWPVAIRQLQKAAGVTVDGDWGPETAMAAQSVDPAKLLQVRADFFRAIVAENPSQSVFLKGWLNRVESLRKHLEPPMPEPTPDPDAVTVYVNGEKLKQTGLRITGVVYVPLRAVCEALGADVQWDGKTQTARVTR